MTQATPADRAARLRQAIARRKRGTARPAADLPRRPADQPPLLGPIQRGLWLAHRLAPDSPAYNLASAFRVRGPLDLDRLRAALAAVVDRHRILRSTFQIPTSAATGAVLQVIHPAMDVPVARVEGGADPAAVATQEAARPFRLDEGPPLRLSWIEPNPPDEPILVLALHHLVADDASLTRLWRDIAEAYGSDGETPELPAVDQPQADDFLAFEETEASDRIAEARAFWRQQLDPPPEPLALPFESSESGAEAERSDAGRLLARRLDPTLRPALHDLATRLGVTPFQLYAFACRLLLCRYTGGRHKGGRHTGGGHAALATPASTRFHPATAEMVGYFLNPVLVPAAVDEERSVEAAIRASNATLRDALRHAALPFQELVETVAPDRAGERHPLFQAMFVHRRRPAPIELGSPGAEMARLDPLTLDLGAAKFDLTLFVTEDDEGGEVAVEYRSGRFEAAWMEQLLEHYETLLRELPRNLDRPVAAVPLASPAEQARLAAFANGPALDPAAPEPLPQRIFALARRNADHPAVHCAGVDHSYGTLLQAAETIAGRLIASGVRPGDRAGLFIDRSFDLIAALLGCHRAAVAYVPLDPAYPEERNRAVLEDAEVAAVLTTSQLRERLSEGAWAVLEIDEEAGDGRSDGNGAAGESAAPDPTTDWPLPGPETPAYLLYTSGSTGRPKGVVVSHGNLAASTAARWQAYDFAPERFLLLPSLAFDSSVAGLFWTLATGGTLVLPTDEEAVDPRRLGRLILEAEVRSLLCVPSLHAQLLAGGSERLESLRAAIVAGESCSSRLVAEHFRQLPQVRLFNEYGPTEATVWATLHEMTPEDARRPVAIGQPIPGVRVEVLDRRGRSVPAGVPGEAHIVGSTVAHGYWRRPGATAERFVPRGDTRTYRTGDRVQWSLDGRLLFLGRVDDQIKLRGFRIEPAEVEAALLALAGVSRASVVVRGDATAGEPAQLVAFVVVEGGQIPTDWRETLRRRLPAHMVPGRLEGLAELPRLPNGKVDRNALRALPLTSGPGREGTEEPLASDRERALRSLWEGLLGRASIGLDENFFELGGHSLLVAEMALAIERDFGASLSAADIFAHPTIRQLAQRVDRGADATQAPYRHLFPIQPQGSGEPFIVAVPHFFSHMLATRFRGDRPVYGLRGVSLRAEGNLGRWPTMRALAEELVDEIARRFPGRRYTLAGYSFGASMAFEAARVMEERGLPIDRLHVITPMALDLVRLGPLHVQLDGLRRPIRELSTGDVLLRVLRERHPLRRRFWARLRHGLTVRPWRRALCWLGRLRTSLGLPLTPRILHADVRVERFRLHSRYRPGTVRVPTVFYNAREPATDAAATWRPNFEGPLDILPIPDPHLGEDAAEAARRLIFDHLESEVNR